MRDKILATKCGEAATSWVPLAKPPLRGGKKLGAGGIYFYLLQARLTDGGHVGEFVETKKMLLVRWRKNLL